MSLLDRRGTKAELPTVHVVGAAILQDGACLAVQRGEDMTTPLKWEFPGGKVESGESAPQALKREILEELALDIDVLELLGQGTVVQRERRIVLDVYRARITGGLLQLREHRALRWLVAQDLEDLEWAPADQPILPSVEQLLRRS